MRAVEDVQLSRFKKPSVAVPDRDGESDNEGVATALARSVTDIDSDWRERIELAKRAYEDGKELREGKPITFRVARPLILGDGSNAYVGNVPPAAALRTPCRKYQS